MNLKEIIGKPTLNPLLFYSGKFAGYVLWSMFCLSWAGVNFNHLAEAPWMSWFSFVLLILGLFIVILSLVKLGSSTRFGLPVAETKLKTGGLYRFSRNPMYLGFLMLNLGGMIKVATPLAILLGLYCSLVYHLIIIREEKFL
jgi:protein-S-isoprenylcysteine O-methyltransferase Ste14